MDTTQPTALIANKDEIMQLLAQVYVRLGIVYDPAATAQKSRALMLQDGVRPEDNAFSCALIAARDE